jgi:hypothetical protein
MKKCVMCPGSSGYLVFPVDDLPTQFHEDFYQQLLDLKGSGKAIGGPDLAACSDAIIRSPTTRGVLTSLLGNDYVGSVWNGGVLDSNDRDQSLSVYTPLAMERIRVKSLAYGG